MVIRRLVRLTRYTLGTSIRSFVLTHMQKPSKCQLTAIGLTTKKLVKAAVEEQFSFTDAQCSHGHTQKKRGLSSAEAELHSIGSGSVEEQHNFCKKGSTKQYRFF